MDSTSRSEERSEIVFFDVETTRARPGLVIIEFGAILVCRSKLVELDHYDTLVRPTDHSFIASFPDRCNGITRDALVSKPTFREIADRVYDYLQGRIWAGHNILRFDCHRIREAFSDIGRPAPEPKGTIDTLALLKRTFGMRAGDMKMATLATYFGLPEQTHRSLDDVRMNLAVLKYCATVLFLESSLPDIFTERDPFDMGLLISESESLEPDDTMEDTMESSETSFTADVSYRSSDSWGFLEPDEVSISAIDACFIPSYRGSQRIQVLHRGVILQLGCMHLKVQLGLSTKFVDRLSFVVNTSQSLCKVLDDIVQKLSSDSGSSSKWRPVVYRKDGSVNYPTVRLHIQTAKAGDRAPYATEIYQKDSSGIEQRLVFSKFDAAELDPLFTPGTFLDAFFSLDPYDYQQNAGIRLVAKKLIIYSK
ncbi:protein NEN1-like [Corylus avellana]|uniref:protein NEN1-like n=1 Tax=Corylus avellana TaxID=13451 RepID=UPI00286D1BB4|nr:protein NEN1-like [Corylus avellana]